MRLCRQPGAPDRDLSEVASTMNQKARDQEIVDVAQKPDETASAMELAGFAFRPTANGRVRWTHKTLGLACVRQPYMTDAQWSGALRGARNRAALCAQASEGGCPMGEVIDLGTRGKPQDESLDAQPSTSPVVALPPLELSPHFGDPETLRNSRDWLQKALEAKGARITGGGCGLGHCDLDFVLEGAHFNVILTPR